MSRTIYRLAGHFLTGIMYGTILSVVAVLAVLTLGGVPA